jgi:hypothetical protein
MRRIAFAVTAALAAMVVGGTPGAIAGDSMFVTATSQGKTLSGDQGADIFGVGGGKADLGMEQFDFSAHEGPNGDFGHVAVTITDPFGRTIVSYSVDVTCVNLHTATFLVGSYDRGIIRGTVKRVSPAPNGVGVDVGDSVIFGIRDGGNPSASTPVDAFFAANADAAGVPCRGLFYVGDLHNVTQGNVNIKGP